VIIIKNY
jgi:hypothetical protein